MAVFGLMDLTPSLVRTLVRKSSWSLTDVSWTCPLDRTDEDRRLAGSPLIYLLRVLLSLQQNMTMFYHRAATKLGLSIKWGAWLCGKRGIRDIGQEKTQINTKYLAFYLRFVSYVVCDSPRHQFPCIARGAKKIWERNHRLDDGSVVRNLICSPFEKNTSHHRRYHQ